MTDTVDGDGVAEAAAQQATTKAIGDLSNAELRQKAYEAFRKINSELFRVVNLLDEEDYAKDLDLAEIRKSVRSCVALAGRVAWEVRP